MSTTTSEPQNDEAEAEATRLSQRASVRRTIAELTLRAEKVSELQNVIDSINEKSDAAAEEHRIATEPLQIELGELHEKQLDQIASKKAGNKIDADRRRALLQQLADANGELEKVVQANAATIKKIKNQIHELLTPAVPESFNKTTLQNQLCGPLARAELRVRMFCLSEKIKVANNWRERAESQLSKMQYMVANPRRFVDRDVANARFSAQQWQAVIADAGKLASDALQEVAAIRKACIEED